MPEQFMIPKLQPPLQIGTPEEAASRPTFSIPIPGAGNLTILPDGTISGLGNIPPELLSRPDVAATIQAAQSRVGSRDVINQLRGIEQLPQLTQTALPQIQELLSQRGQFLLPQIEAIRERGAEMTANAQSDIGGRGLRGSDIEQATLLGARGQALTAESQLRGNFALESSKILSDLIFKAMLGDVEAATQLRVYLAQAMGQQLGGERDILAAGIAGKSAQDEAEKNRRNATKNAWIQGAMVLGGSLLGGLVGAAGGAASSSGSVIGSSGTGSEGSTPQSLR